MNLTRTAEKVYNSS